MALTTVAKEKFNMGGAVFRIFELTFTGVTGGEVKTGAANVYAAWYQPNKTDDHGFVTKNSASTSTTQDDGGSVYINGVSSGDTGLLYCLTSA